jgi:hypothetical protein
VRGDAPQTGSIPFVAILTRMVDEKRCNQDVALYDKTEYIRKTGVLLFATFCTFIAFFRGKK